MSADTAARPLRYALGHTRFPAHQTLHWRRRGQIYHDCFCRSGTDPAPARRIRAASLAKASSSEA